MAGFLTRFVRTLPIPSHHPAVEGPHAQFGEDRILERIFNGRERGYCAEVGAYDGRTGSATLLFERKGWQCLLVEPVPELAEQIGRSRRCIVKNCAASSEAGETTLFLAENVEQMSTLEPDGDHHRWVREVGGSVREITVRTARLDDLLDEAHFSALDFLTIDVEGHEPEVLRGLSLERFKPRIVIVEENLNLGVSSVARHMALHGYVNFKRTGVNEWYAHEADTELIEPEAIRRFKLEKRVLRAQQTTMRFLERYLPGPVKRTLSWLLQLVVRRR